MKSLVPVYEASRPFFFHLISFFIVTLWSDTIICIHAREYVIDTDFRAAKKSWFYWYFRITGAANRTLVFQFPGNYLASFGPAISMDEGLSWQWFSDPAINEHRQFSYSFPEDVSVVHFSMGIPYLQSDLDRYLSLYKNSQLLHRGILTQSGKGRPVERLLIKAPDKQPEHRVLLTSRHHACEAMANYVLEEIISAILCEEEDEMLWLREK